MQGNQLWQRMLPEARMGSLNRFRKHIDQNVCGAALRSVEAATVCSKTIGKASYLNEYGIRPACQSIINGMNDVNYGVSLIQILGLLAGGEDSLPSPSCFL